MVGPNVRHERRRPCQRSWLDDVRSMEGLVRKRSPSRMLMPHASETLGVRRNSEASILLETRFFERMRCTGSQFCKPRRTAIDRDAVNSEIRLTSESANIVRVVAGEVRSVVLNDGQPPMDSSSAQVVSCEPRSAFGKRSLSAKTIATYLLQSTSEVVAGRERFLENLALNHSASTGLAGTHLAARLRVRWTAFVLPNVLT